MHAEVREVISAGEAQFELWRRRSGLVLAPLAFVGLWGAPLGVEPPAHRLAAVLGAVVVLWITEAIPMAITAFLGVAVTVALHVAPAAEAFAPFADPLIFLFIGTFMLAQAIFFHRLDRRFAFAILGLHGVGEHPGRVLVAYASVACVLSMWISNTATTAMMFPIGVSILSFLESPQHRGAVPRTYGTILLLSTAFAASIGGLATPVGTPPNLIGIGFIRHETGLDLPFFSWMALGLPLVTLLLAATLIDLWHSGVPRRAQLRGIAQLIAAERAALGPWTRGQINTMIAFGTTVCLWVSPGVIALIAGQDHPVYKELTSALPEGVVALLGAGLLFLLPINLRATSSP
jgi:sodium-dependent dicarboxylate transporter 2/3/5